MRTYIKNGVVALAATLSAMATSASAQELPKVCFPVARDIPGYVGNVNSMPSWQATGRYERPDRLNEPRWAPGPLTAFYNDNGNADSNEGGYRLVLSQDRNTLAVSIQNKADNVERSLADGVSFGIYKPGFGRAALISLRLGTGTTDPNRYTGSGVTAYQTAATPVAASTDWTIDATNASGWLKDVASWTRHSTTDGGADWGIQFKVDLTQFNLGASPFQIHIGMRKARGDVATPGNSADDTIVNFVQVDPAISSDYDADDFIGSTIDGVYTDTTGIPWNTAHWTTPNLLTEGCPAGIELNWNLVGALGADNVTLTNELVARPGVTNRFVARALTNGTTVAQNYLSAKISIANWGAQIAVPEAQWSPIDGGSDLRNSAVRTDAAYATAFPGSNGTYVEWRHDCTNPATAPERWACGVQFSADADPDQCMLVEIKPVGSRKIPIKNASVYRNMRFEGLSFQNLPAHVSIKGLNARTHYSGARDIHLQVVTRNMPEYGDFPVFLNSYWMNVLKSLLTGAVASIDLLGNGLSLSYKDLMKMVWPTYEVHSYWDTGARARANGKRFKLVQPMNSFGYYFSHTGPLFGYQHGLTRTSFGDFGTPQAGYHVVRVSNEGSAKIATAVSAEEIPRFLAPIVSSFCDLFPWACGDGGGQ